MPLSHDGNVLKPQGDYAGNDSSVASEHVGLVTELFNLLSAVDTTSEEAKLNEWSMDDNNGGRILF